MILNAYFGRQWHNAEFAEEVASLVLELIASLSHERPPKNWWRDEGMGKITAWQRLGTRLADLNAIVLKLVAATFGMSPEGVLFYLADHLNAARKRAAAKTTPDHWNC